MDAKKPLVLAVDADKATREMLKSYLTGEGYNVIAVATNIEAREALKIMTPALVIAEIEGENLPGYDLCVAHQVHPAPEVHPRDADDQLRVSKRLCQRAFAGRGRLHREAFQAGTLRTRGAHARSSARGKRKVRARSPG